MSNPTWRHGHTTGTTLANRVTQLKSDIERDSLHGPQSRKLATALLLVIAHAERRHDREALRLLEDAYTGRTARMQEVAEVAALLTCARCNAQPEQPCRTATGKPTAFHHARLHYAASEARS